jgi:hypothetical protein
MGKSRKHMKRTRSRKRGSKSRKYRGGSRTTAVGRSTTAGLGRTTAGYTITFMSKRNGFGKVKKIFGPFQTEAEAVKACLEYFFSRDNRTGLVFDIIEDQTKESINEIKARLLRDITTFKELQELSKEYDGFYDDDKNLDNAWNISMSVN